MDMLIEKAALGGTVGAIPSKSEAHRLLIAAALSEGSSLIKCDRASDDIMSTSSCLAALGAKIVRTPLGFEATHIERAPEAAVLDCGESASTLRFLLPVAAALGVNARFIMRGRLSARPIEPITELLRANGASVAREGDALGISGRLKGQSFSIEGSVSSQFISGLMLALPILGGGEVNITTNAVSRNYIDITSRILNSANIYVNQTEKKITVSGEYTLSGSHKVGGDWSNAAFWLAAGAAGDKPVSVTGLDINSAQGDRAIIPLLRSFGAKVEATGDTVTTYPSRLRAQSIDAGNIPDLVPVLAALCACAEGESRIYNAARLRFKESDRLNALVVMLTELGCYVSETEDGLIIRGSTLHGGRLCSFGDHRIVMAEAVLGAKLGGVVITDAEAVNKSYPDFFNDFTMLGGKCHERL